MKELELFLRAGGELLPPPWGFVVLGEVTCLEELVVVYVMADF